MAKKKKTRQQKIVADLKRQLLKKTLSSHTETSVEKPKASEKKEFKEKEEEEQVIKTTNKKEDGLNYDYLIHDLKKTAILTSSVIALQIILFLVLTNKILILPGLSY